MELTRIHLVGLPSQFGVWVLRQVSSCPGGCQGWGGLVGRSSRNLMTVARDWVSPAFLISAFSAPLYCLSLHILSTPFHLLASQGVQTTDQGHFPLQAPRAQGGCYLSSLDSRPQEIPEPRVPLLHSRKNSRGSHKKATKVVWAPGTA